MTRGGVLSESEVVMRVWPRLTSGTMETRFFVPKYSAEKCLERNYSKISPKGSSR